MIISKYESRYRSDKRVAVYPLNLSLRAFLGFIQNSTCLKKNSTMANVYLTLVMAMGETCRTCPIGMKIHGLEISEDINRHVKERLAILDIHAELKVGTNAHIPYDNGFFPIRCLPFMLLCRPAIHFATILLR